MNQTRAKTLKHTPALALIIALSASLLGGCGGEAKVKTAEVQKAPVEVSTVTRGPIEAHYLASTPIRPEREATIVAEAQGAVLKLLVEEGDRVEKGQALARLDVDRAALTVLQSAAVVARLENDHQRLERLGTRDLVSRDMRDQSRFELLSQRASLNLAQLAVDKATIRAPFAGVITLRNVKVGQLVKMNDPVFSIADFSLLTAVMSVPERQAHALHTKQFVGVNFDAIPNKQFAGSILRISPVVDAASGTFEATVAIEDPDSMLRPGLFARLNVLTEKRLNALQVPKGALISSAAGNQVWIVDGDQARLKPVQIGLDYQGMVEIREGLNPDARVVTQGHDSLSEGMQVQVLKTQTAQVVAR